MHQPIESLDIIKFVDYNSKNPIGFFKRKIIKKEKNEIL